jgi:hypothetical protein
LDKHVTRDYERGLCRYSRRHLVLVLNPMRNIGNARTRRLTSVRVSTKKLFESILFYVSVYAIHEIIYVGPKCKNARSFLSHFDPENEGKHISDALNSYK